jgi:hypothetical protein
VEGVKRVDAVACREDTDEEGAPLVAAVMWRSPMTRFYIAGNARSHSGYTILLAPFKLKSTVSTILVRLNRPLESKKSKYLRDFSASFASTPNRNQLPESSREHHITYPGHLLDRSFNARWLCHDCLSYAF